MFIIDTSRHIGRENFERVKNFVKNVIRYFRISPSHVRVGVITYSTWPKDHINLNTYKHLRQVLRAIDRIPYVSGQEYTNRALYFARRASFSKRFGARQHVSNVAIVITDGKSNSFAGTRKQAILLKRHHVKVFVVAVGKVYMPGLDSIASAPHAWFVIRVPNYVDLQRYAYSLVYRLYWSK